MLQIPQVNHLFQKKMEDIIRGARLCQGDIATYNSQVLTTIKEELKSRDPDVKAAAIVKLFYVNKILSIDIVFEQ